ncbi:DNA repair protein RadA, partial [Myxococcota bacterium]|nr:DNA repair protein RadA [Myxococcota bacterium]
IDNQRVAMLSAALESRAGVAVTGMDLYVNVAGGVKISEPAADLGVVLSLASTVADFPLPPDLVTIGEVGLSGEVRAVSQLGLRLQEAQALGFKSALVPKVDMDRWSGPLPEIRTIPVANLREALREVKIVE